MKSARNIPGTFLCYFLNAFFVNMPDNAAIPPTNPPIKAVINNNSTH